jgi:ribosome biogenesis GTPase A
MEGRYGVAVPRLDPADASTAVDGEAWLEAAAGRHTSGDTARMAQRLLDDFRRSLLGAIALELPP